MIKVASYLMLAFILIMLIVLGSSCRMPIRKFDKHMIINENINRHER